MSRRAVRTWLWIVAFATLPVLYFVPEAERAPTLRLAFITTIMSAVYVTEGAGQLVWAWLMAGVQLAVWTLLLFAGAAVSARLMGRLSAPARTWVTLVLAGTMVGASLLEIYVTPLSSTRMRSSLLHVFE
jgi:hypothetical protein